MKHLKFVLSGMVVVFLVIASPAYSQGGLPDTLENRRIAAERYLAAVPPAELIADGIRELAALRPEGQREEAARRMRELVQPDRLRRIMLETLVRRFTVQELEALASFYGSSSQRTRVQIALSLVLLRRDVLVFTGLAASQPRILVF